jgi:hypothetical protein
MVLKVMEVPKPGVVCGVYWTELLKTLAKAAQLGNQNLLRRKIIGGVLYTAHSANATFTKIRLV